MKCAFFLFPKFAEEKMVHPLIYISNVRFLNAKEAFQDLAKHFYYEMLANFAESPERLKSYFDMDEYIQQQDFADFILQKYTVIDQYNDFMFKSTNFDINSPALAFLTPYNRALMEDVESYFSKEQLHWSAIGLAMNIYIHSISKLKSYQFVLVGEFAEVLLWCALGKYNNTHNFTYIVAGCTIEPVSIERGVQ